MDQAQNNALKAVKDDRELKAMHERFVVELESAALLKSEIGTMIVSSASITCTCLGHTVTVTHRPIADDGSVCAMEYDFLVKWKKDDLSILRIYLQANGILTRDVGGTVKFQDFNNTYNKSHILAVVCSSLLASPVFKPTEG
jgi:hypothetical protein